MTEAYYRKDGFDVSAPSAFIQWKGTDVCMDFRCDCGEHHHIDADFVYAVRCTCGQLWEMPHTIRPLKVEAYDGSIYQCVAEDE